jgi:hypothetical protein
MKWLFRLYPPAWRDRYEEEFAAMLEQHRLSNLEILNIVFMATRTRLTTGRGVKRRHSHGNVVAGILAVALCASVGSVALSSLQGPTVHASPAISTKATIYHRVNGQWKHTSTVERGETARFTLSFRQHGFRSVFVPLRVNLFLQHGRFSPKGTSFYGRVVYRATLGRIRHSRLFAFFSANVTIPKTLSGQFYLQFNAYGVNPAQQIGAVADAVTIK